MPISLVKSVNRTAATGRPSNVDGHVDPTVTLLEERVVMFEAVDHRDALRQATREARAYARETHVNPYGPRVKTRHGGALSSFEPFGPAAPGVEVFSETGIAPAMVTDDEIIERRKGPSSRRPRRRDGSTS